MWEIYDQLINDIPSDIIADEINVGYRWTFVRSGSNVGLCSIYPVESRLPLFSKNFTGLPLREVAECIKSWNFVEASIGGAAMNAYYNSASAAEQNNIEFSKSKFVDDRRHDPFISYQQEIKEKNVAVVGHFPYLEALFKPVCNLSIIEIEPSDGDYPFFASEFLLPEQDYVFITASALVNKSLPRILELSKNAYNVLVGPSTPMVPCLFSYGINDLSGFMVKDSSLIRNILTGAQYGSLYSGGQKIHWRGEN